MTASDLERFAAFERRFTEAQASDRVELPWGFALLQAEFPLSHYHNRVVVTSSAPAEEILRVTDEVLGSAGVGHRFVSTEDDGLGESLRPVFEAAGYEYEPVATMLHGGGEVAAPAHLVRAVSLDEMRSTMERDWRIELPSATDEEITQLAGRTVLCWRGADTSLLAIFDEDEIVARADLYIDREDRIAQFENLFTHPDHRGRGYGDSLLSDALRRGHEAGCELSFLTADIGDWPHDWYSRRGYRTVSRIHIFDRMASHDST